MITHHNLKKCRECGAQFLDLDWMPNRVRGYCNATHKRYIAELEREAQALAIENGTNSEDKEYANLNLPWD